MRFIFICLLPLAMLSLMSVPSRADSRCISDWSQAAPIVRKEGLYSVESLTTAARGKIQGDIVKTTLCQDDGVWVYRLIVRVKGAMSIQTVDAKDPFPR